MVRDLSVKYEYVYVTSGSILDEDVDGQRDDDDEITRLVPRLSLQESLENLNKAYLTWTICLR